MKNRELFNEIVQRVKQLTAEERLLWIEKIAGMVRMDEFTDHEAIRKGLEEMAADPATQEDLELWRSAENHASR
jgi:hypothetical protein